MKVVMRFGRFLVVAGLSAAGDWAVFSIMVSLLYIDSLGSLMTARLVGGLISFLSNRNWTWGARNHLALTQQGRRFLLLYLASYGLSVSLFSVLTRIFAIDAYLGKLFADAFCFFVNFLVMDAYVYNRRSGVIAWAADALCRLRGKNPA